MGTAPIRRRGHLSLVPPLNPVLVELLLAPVLDFVDVDERVTRLLAAEFVTRDDGPPSIRRRREPRP